jgi:N-acetylmuramoyl-L-alanine amidase
MLRWLLPFVVSLALAAPSLPSRPLFVGAEVGEVVYPGGLGIAYAPARLLARALGLGLLEFPHHVDLALGSQIVTYPLSTSPLQAAKQGEAWLDQAQTWVPLKDLARRLNLDFRFAQGAFFLGLKPAQLLGVSETQASGQTLLTFRFDRDVEATLRSGSPPRLALIGVVSGNAGSLSATSKPYGLEVSLPELGTPSLFYLPDEVVVAFGTPQQPPLVVLDPEGGGQNPGVQVGSLQGAALTYRLAQQVAQLLKGTSLRVQLTRSANSDPSLLQRAAQGAFAQVFVSLTLGSQTNLFLPAERGLSWIRKGKALLAEAPQPQQSWLASLLAPSGASQRLAQSLAHSLAGLGILAGQARGPYLVLSQVGGAGVLVEVGASSLKSSADQSAFAQALAQGILNYLNESASGASSSVPANSSVTPP